ncbi:MNL2 (YLR057W) [Zygosaccharomyces parabailii]|nr:MNL2 (YLR057W) [Zygosaccharomyces parabailii]CDH13904.1 related to Putative alpha-mannosidase [Zygosaccharomyces bailii ISA1307]SJM88491.1 related to Putative endoplasmic reticulum mannosidase MNL2 [Zygosaccharomyces bailii]
MSLLRLIQLGARKLQSVLLLGVTICLLFYYTFENEIDMLNSYAENDYMPSINGAAISQGVEPDSNVQDELPKPKPEAVTIDLRDPKVLKEKNKYFPLLLSSPWRGSTRFQDSWSNFELVDLKNYKEKHAVLNEISLPLNFQQIPPDYAQVQTSVFEDGGHQEKKALREIKQLFLKSWEQDQMSNPDTTEGWPLSLIDSLDTLLIMGETQKFQKAVEILSTVDFSTPALPEDSIDIPDVTTRVLGGLISAYDLSKDPILLSKSKQLANFILRAFDTPNRIPILQYFWKTEYGNRFPYQYLSVGALTNMALELTRLSQITNTNKYFDAIQRIFQTMALSLDEFSIEHLFPTRVDGSGCRILTAHEVSSGHHLRNPKVMKSIDQNLEFVHCHQTGKFLISPRDWEKKEQLFKMDFQGQSVYANLVKIFHLLNGHDILMISKTYHPKEHEVELENSREKAVDDPKNNKPASEQSNKIQLHDSQQLFSIAMHKVRNLMLYRPLTPAGENLTLISSLQTNTRASPATNELQVEVTKLFDMNYESCSLAATLGLASSLFNDTEYLTFAKEIAHSYYNMVKLFDGIYQEELYLDPCEKQNCLFNKDDKIQDIADGRYAHASTSGIEESKVRMSGSQKEDEHDGILKILMFGLSQGLDDLSYNIDDINVESGEWKADPSRPLWVNKMGKKSLLSPNVIESMFYMYRITGESRWRQMGRDLLEMTIKILKATHSGAKGVWKVGESDEEDNWVLPSSWFSQTLKYYYLLFSDVEDFTLDEYIYTAGGHLMKRDLKKRNLKSGNVASKM